MKSITLDSVTDIILESWRLAFVGVLALSICFALVEPTMGRAAASASDTFTIRQQVTDEISFLTTAADVTMVGAIQGVSGGHATGSTYAVIRSNSNSGYTLDISFLNSPAMLGETNSGTGILNYGTTSEPTYGFLSSSSAQFAYSVSASTTADLDQSFKNNGTSCNAGAGFTASTCWMGPSTTANRIVNRSTSAPSGATTTITFRITIPSNPSPSVEEDFYTATATLTATNQ